MAKRTGVFRTAGRTRWGKRLETAIILWLNRFFPPPRFILHTEDAARKPREELQEEEFRTSGEAFISLKKLTSLRDSMVLDLACGSGIKTTSYATASTEIRHVVGIDMDAQALKQGSGFSHVRGMGRVTFMLADAGALPFKDQSMDIVISVNGLEHVLQPQGALQEGARVLKDQGILSLKFFPLYYSRYGSHLWDYLCVPWVHVWASSEAVVAAYRQIIEAEAPRLLREFAGRYEKEDIKTYLAFQLKQFMTLNKLTPREFYRAVAATGGWQILHFGLFETPRLERLLAYCPGMDRFTVWGIHCVLRRDSRSEMTPRAFTRWRWRQDLGGMRRKFAAWTKAMLGRCRGSPSPQSP